MSTKKLLLLIILVGTLFRCFGITQHWRTHDHYNYGGPINTAYTLCLKKTPLSISRGLPHFNCESGDPAKMTFYTNHPPFLYWGLWGLTSVLGDGEWVYRLFTLIFSILNIWLVYRVARHVWPRGPEPLFAAFFQSFFLGTIYFGTHVDFPAEFTTSFILLSALAALNELWWLASLFAILSGFTDWPGYFMFSPLLAYAWLRGRGVKQVIVGGFLGALTGLEVMSYLQGTWNLFSFLQNRMAPSIYLKETKTLSGQLLLPFIFIKTFIASHSRMLSPLFAVFAFGELLFGEARKLFAFGRNYASKLNTYHHALILTGGTGLVTFAAGFQYVMVHIFWLILWMPLMALLCAQFASRCLDGKNKISKNVVALGLVFAALYPYGVYKTNTLHDAINSVALAGGCLFFIFSKRLSKQTFFGLLTLTAVFNFSQVVNYRNEPDSEYSFCQKARAQFSATGQPVVTQEPGSWAQTYLYCRGVTVIYQK